MIFILFLGQTGPLVYPAFFVYIYSIFYFITSRGQNIRLAQYIFIIIYLAQIYLTLRLYSKSRKVPPFLLILSAFTSYRIHSIYVLRLFNDPIAILLLYGALNLFLDQKWSWGSVCFSLAVGIKMNILLFAPAILLMYIVCLGNVKTIIQLGICGLVQVIIGLPFLLTYPVEYLKGSFNLGRIFEHQWTVNYRFLDKSFFEDKLFHIVLLLIHIALLAVFAKPCILYMRNYARLRELQSHFQPQIDAENRNVEMMKKQKKKKPKVPKEKEEEMTKEQKDFLKSFEKGLKSQMGPKAAGPPKEEKPEPQEIEETQSKYEIHFDQCTQLALLPIFLANLIGVVCARSLHYQFYVWYFHSLPYLSWFTDFHASFKILLLLLIEFCWNKYPSTIFSSTLLHICHIFLLVGIAYKLFRSSQQSKMVLEANKKEQ